MTPGPISRRVVADRLALVDELIRDIRSLPLRDPDTFLGDKRNVWAAESCLRRCLEALLGSSSSSSAPQLSTHRRTSACSTVLPRSAEAIPS